MGASWGGERRRARGQHACTRARALEARAARGEGAYTIQRGGVVTRRPLRGRACLRETSRREIDVCGLREALTSAQQKPGRYNRYVN